MTRNEAILGALTSDNRNHHRGPERVARRPLLHIHLHLDGFRLTRACRVSRDASQTGVERQALRQGIIRREEERRSGQVQTVDQLFVDDHAVRVVLVDTARRDRLRVRKGVSERARQVGIGNDGIHHGGRRLPFDVNRSDLRTRRKPLHLEEVVVAGIDVE